MGIIASIGVVGRVVVGLSGRVAVIGSNGSLNRLCCAFTADDFLLSSLMA